MDKILVVDDEAQIRKLLARMMELEGYEVFNAGDCKSALKMIEFHTPEVVICDVFLPDGNGIEFVTNIKKIYPKTEVVLLTAHGNIPDCVQAIKNGAFDYITKGNENNKIIPLVSRAMEKARMNNMADKKGSKIKPIYSLDSILGQSKVIKEVLSLALKVSVTQVPVLLTGETGTGKEVFAQAIHQNSPRNMNNFVAVNCSSFSKELLESEMFGHKAGSFTGALKDKKGLFEEADNGTIFLDEIGEMAFELQAKLLRILETGEYIKLGETKPTKVNVRIIAATNRDLKKEINKGCFREDLFYRLSVFQIHLPPLRERQEDIEILAQFFVRSFSEKLRYPPISLTTKVIDIFKEYPWKGNIRELRNVIERSLIVGNNNSLEPEDLPLDMQNIHLGNSDGKGLSDFEMNTMERRHIARVLQYTKGNKSEAARLLKIGLTTLYRKIEEYKL
ncbi:MAG: ntrC 1 [Bacteroidetes bacterium]|nr:ntrC 1 [Bacteroidota bacterium]